MRQYPIPRSRQPDQFLVYTFEYIASIIDKGVLVLGSFQILIDVVGDGPVEY
jgi:hypothetical protein